MYTAKEYQQLLISIFQMKVGDIDRKMSACKDSFEEEKLAQYQMGLYEAIDTINKSSFLIEEE